MPRLIKITKTEEIPSHLRYTPVGLLLEYHNLHRPFDPYTRAALLVGMCMDNRKQLRLPQNFAYTIRTAGARMQHTGFDISFAVAVGGIKHMAVIGHTQCGMVHLESVRTVFVEGLVQNGGWDAESAAQHFAQQAPLHETGNETAFTLAQTRQLRGNYPKLTITPLIYRVEDNQLYLVDETGE